MPGAAAEQTDHGRSTRDTATRAAVACAERTTTAEQAACDDDIYLTATWDAATVDDNVPVILHMHLHRVDSRTGRTGLGFTVALPIGITVAKTVANIDCSGTLAPTLGATSVDVSAVEMPSDVGDCDATVYVRAGASGTYTIGDGAATSVTGVFNGITTQTLTVTVAPPVVKAVFSTTPISVGDTSTFTVRLNRTDTNMATSASGLGFRITLPAGLSLATDGTNTCGGTVTRGGQVLSVTGAALPSGPTACLVTSTVTGDVGGTYVVNSSTLDQIVAVTNGLSRGCAQLPTEGAAQFAGAVCIASLVVNKLAQTITFAQPADTSVAKGTLTTAATASSGLAVSLSSSTPSVCTASGGTVTLVASGTCTVTADQAGNGMYGPAISVTRSFTVRPRAASPSSVVATAGVSSISVTWHAPVDLTGLTGYTAIAEPGPATCTTTGALQCVMGATAGVTYTVRVVANSSEGDSVATAPSNEVTPTAPVVADTPPDTNLVLTTDKGLITTAVPSQDIVVIGTGFAAHSTATIVIYSTPTVLGTVVTDAQGDFNRTVTVPATLAAGAHTLVAAGVDSSGNPHSLKLVISVAARGAAAALPVTGAPVGSLALLGLALMLTGAGLRCASSGRRWV